MLSDLPMPDGIWSELSIAAAYIRECDDTDRHTIHSTGKIMKNLNVRTIALAVGLAFSAGAMAENMSKAQYEFLGKNLEANYKLAEAGCSSLTGNANAICAAQATGNRSITKAELETNYKPSVKTRYDARAATADSDYSVATVECDGEAATSKAACMNEARAVKAHQMADAMVEVRTSKPDVL